MLNKSKETTELAESHRIGARGTTPPSQSIGLESATEEGREAAQDSATYSQSLMLIQKDAMVG